MEDTDSSIKGCILMKFKVSSGNSLDVLYFSSDADPAQQPGLSRKDKGGDCEEEKAVKTDSTINELLSKHGSL